MGPPLDQQLQPFAPPAGSVTLRNVAVDIRRADGGWQGFLRHTDLGTSWSTSVLPTFDEAQQATLGLLCQRIPNAIGREVISANGLLFPAAPETAAQSTPRSKAA